MIKEILFSICMMLPGACGIKNSIEITPTKVVGSDYEMTVKKQGVLKKEYNGEIHYPVIVELTVFNTSKTILTFKLSEVRFHDSKGQVVGLYRNIPTHVLDRELIVNPSSKIDLDIYLISYDLNERIKFEGIVK